jgi:hypothetical protein
MVCPGQLQRAGANRRHGNFESAGGADLAGDTGPQVVACSAASSSLCSSVSANQRTIRSG